MYIHTCVGISHTHTHTHTHTPYTHSRQQSGGKTQHNHIDDRLSRGGEEGCQVKGEHDSVAMGDGEELTGKREGTLEWGAPLEKYSILSMKYCLNVAICFR